jgi:transaldolase
MHYKEANFSLWCDFIERDFLNNDFIDMVDDEIVNGATSNPAIFKNAILTSPAYKEEIEMLCDDSPKEIYEALAIKDIQISADILNNIHKQSDNGYVSIEVDPFLCDDTKATVEEAKRLTKAIHHNNVMIKIPATDAGFKAMQELISEGININATLVFSPTQGSSCLKALQKGINKFKKSYPKKRVPSAVISIFVSRFDRKLDKQLKEKGLNSGLVGIYNATKIYHEVQKNSNENIRALFASTGVKGDEYDKAYYITSLLYKDAVNTAPIETIDEFFKSGKTEIIEPVEEEKIDKFFNTIQENGIDLNTIYSNLMSEGLESFKEAFEEILKELEKG